MPVYQLLNDDKGKLQIPTKILRDKYLVPPFSILDTSVGAWFQRRNEWEAMIQNRGNNVRNVVIKKHLFSCLQRY